VAKRIVRGREHHAGSVAAVARQVGEPGGGDDPDRIGLAPRAPDSRDQGFLHPGPGLARVAPDQHAGGGTAPALFDARQVTHERGADGGDGRRIERVFASDGADADRPEQSLQFIGSSSMWTLTVTVRRTTRLLLGSSTETATGVWKEMRRES